MTEKFYPILKITAEEIKDSRGDPTIKVTAYAEYFTGSFSVPSGASTGAHEARELRDPDGGMKKAISNVEKIISPALAGKNIFDQKDIDETLIKLDGTLNKDNLGGNAMVGASIACAKLAAAVSGLPVFEYLRKIYEIKPSIPAPRLFMNMFEGGKHAGNQLAFQEYLLVPLVDDVRDAIECGIKVQNTLERILIKELGVSSIPIGHEGGLAPGISEVRLPLLYLSEAIKENNLEGKVKIALDAAASSFYKDGQYTVDGRKISKEELMEIYLGLIEEFDLFSIEDPFQEEDFEGFRRLKEKSGETLVVGDDLTVTNKTLLKKAIDTNSVRAMIIKPNQVGTLSETLETMKLAREAGIELIVSHRGEETNDDFIADLAYAYGCFGLKAGSPLSSERMVKYRRLMEIIIHEN